MSSFIIPIPNDDDNLLNSLRKSSSFEISAASALNCQNNCSSVSCVKVLTMLTENQNTHSAEQDYQALSPREKEVLGHLTKGMSYKMIADTCGISYGTVNSHLKKIYEKLHVHSATEAVQKALLQKIV